MFQVGFEVNVQFASKLRHFCVCFVKTYLELNVVARCLITIKSCLILAIFDKTCQNFASVRIFLCHMSRNVCRNIPEVAGYHTRRCENLKPHFRA